MGNEHSELLGRDVVASDGAKLGHVADVYVDPATGAPKWLVVPSGLLSSTVSFVPADGARHDGDDRIVIGFTRKQVRKAPHPDADGDLSPSEEAALARHYLATATADADVEQVAAEADPAFDPTVETDLSTVRDADPTEEWLIDPAASDGTSMVRAEEELQVEAAPRPVQRARLVKRVVTEHVTFTVPVRREVLHLEYEDVAEDAPIAPSAAAGCEPFEPTPDQEFLLYAEIVEYEKKVVPKERVRLHKEVEEEVVELGADLRREVVDVANGAPEPSYR